MIRPTNIIKAAPIETERVPDWREQAACREVEPELFHVPGDSWESATNRPQLDLARAVCETCPAKAACLAWALSVNDSHALLGGLTPQQRQRLKRSRQRKRAS